ncbi:MAG TPA: Wzz/FepE/Etk N-terminal domain-containing protein, partial [Burkholderiaceae bacterium]|nr:Wzz/FepE/Etk N-terminal domain-containing protein [Burkholderiaceae bacterium]
MLALSDIASALRHDWRRWVAAIFCAGALGAAGSYLITPEFTSTASFLPPQQQQSSAAAALSSLGALAGLAGASVKSPAEQYVALMQSVTVSDRMVDRFGLLKVYDKKYR